MDYRAVDAETFGAGVCFASLWVRRIADWHFIVKAVPYELKLGRSLLLSSARGVWQSSNYYLTGRYVDCYHVDALVCVHGVDVPIAHGGHAGTRFAIRFAKNVQLSLPCQCAGCGCRHTGISVCTGRVAGVQQDLVGGRQFECCSCGLCGDFELPRRCLQRRCRYAHPCFLSPATDGMSRGSILALLFISGLVSMGLEVVWIRQLTPYLGNVVYAFSGILAVYLLATFMGSRAYRSGYVQTRSAIAHRDGVAGASHGHPADWRRSADAIPPPWS